MGIQSKTIKIDTNGLSGLPDTPNGYRCVAGNLVHKTAEIFWDKVEIGHGNKIGPFCVIGGEAEHKFYESEGKIKIGSNNFFHNGVVVSMPTQISRVTSIGNNCTFMSSSVIHHDCMIEDDVIVSSNVSIGGSVHVMCGANIGMNAAIHQFKVIGAFSMLGINSCVIKQTLVTPGHKFAGVPAINIGSNLIGLSRLGVSQKLLQHETHRFNKLEIYMANSFG